jgi:Peptide N-acetyl-beta-D-glucosaminyl asparaginase amidase A
VPCAGAGKKDHRLHVGRSWGRLVGFLLRTMSDADEFWCTNAPNDVATELEEYGGTGFRETEISIDGQPAGLAPVYPWIFTGGIDPFLWVPIPGVQTLNFVPYRVDLTPFAALLSNGESHTNRSERV